MISILFACGCPVQQVNPDKVASPRCLQCGEPRIARTVNAPNPTIKGHGRGPLVKSERLDAIPVTLATMPLKLKRRKDEDDGDRAVR